MKKTIRTVWVHVGTRTGEKFVDVTIFRNGNEDPRSYSCGTYGNSQARRTRFLARAMRLQMAHFLAGTE